MLKKIALILVAGCFIIAANAQVDKTKLSLDASKKNEQNIKQLSSYTWKRNLEGFKEGEKVVSILSSVTMGPDGKPVNQVVEKAGPKPSKKQAQAAEYVKNAVDLVSKYIFLSTGQMIDLFGKGTLSVIQDDLRAEAFDFFAKGDHLKYTFDKTTLNYKSQELSTLLNGEPVKATVTFKMVDDINTVDKVVIDLPAKKMKVNMTNSEYAKKL